MNNSQMLKDLATSAMKIANERENSIVEIHKNTSQKIEQRLNTILTTSTQKIESDIEKLHDIIASLSTQQQMIENAGKIRADYSEKMLQELKTQLENINKTATTELYNLQQAHIKIISNLQQEQITAIYNFQVAMRTSSMLIQENFHKKETWELNQLTVLLIVVQLITNACIIFAII